MQVKSPVKTIMRKNVLTLHPKDKIQQARDIFDQYDLHHIPIVVMNKVVGIVSQGDILHLTKRPIMISFDKFIRDQKISIEAIEEVMSKNVICIDHETSIEQAIKIMMERRVNALPVNDNDELVGLITTYDILKNLIK